MAKKLRILEVTPYFYPAWAYGGVPRVVYELSREMAKRGHDVTVCTTDVLDGASRHGNGRSVIDGVQTYYFRNLSNSLAYNYQLYLPLGLVSFIRENLPRYDVVHLHSHRHFLNNIVHFYARRCKKPYILSGHGTVLRIERRILAKAVFDKFFGRRVLRDASSFIAVSETEVEQYEKMGIDKAKVRVIYNGIDCAAFEGPRKEGFLRDKYGLHGKKIVLYLGRISQEKGVEFLVNAFSELNDGSAVLVIAGNDMGFKERLDRIIKERSIEGRVVFTGFISGDDKLSAYRDADVLVYPGVYDIFGLVPFEAIMCGTPVIVTSECGGGRIIGREGIGYTVKYLDVQGLKGMIADVLAGREDALKKVEKGKEFIKRRLSWEKIGREYEEAYKGVL